MKHELSLCVCISEDDIECSDWFLVMHLSNSSSSEPWKMLLFEKLFEKYCYLGDVLVWLLVQLTLEPDMLRCWAHFVKGRAISHLSLPESRLSNDKNAPKILQNTIFFPIIWNFLSSVHHSRSLIDISHTNNRRWNGDGDFRANTPAGLTYLERKLNFTPTVFPSVVNIHHIFQQRVSNCEAWRSGGGDGCRGSRNIRGKKTRRRSACRYLWKWRKLVVVLPAFNCDSQRMEAVTLHKVAK